MNPIIFPILCVVAIAAAIYFMRSKKDDEAAGVVTEQPKPQSLAGAWQGRVDMPPQEVRLANRAKQLAEGNELGGGVDGGIYLEGAFGFETNAAGDVIAGEFVLHGRRSKANGNVLHGAGHEGGPFTAMLSGTGITGRVSEGGGREWVYGDLVGTFIPNGRI
jgi:hypothetical protein